MEKKLIVVHLGRAFLTGITVIFVGLYEEAIAQDVAVSCQITQNIKGIDAQNVTVQDDWHAYQSDYEMGNGTYFVTTLSDGYVFHATGGVRITPTKYILTGGTDADGFLIIKDETYIDRVTGSYYSAKVMQNLKFGGSLSFISSGECRLKDMPMTKF